MFQERKYWDISIFWMKFLSSKEKKILTYVRNFVLLLSWYPSFVSIVCAYVIIVILCHITHFALQNCEIFLVTWNHSPTSRIASAPSLSMNEQIQKVSVWMNDVMNHSSSSLSMNEQIRFYSSKSRIWCNNGWLKKNLCTIKIDLYKNEFKKKKQILNNDVTVNITGWQKLLK